GLAEEIEFNEITSGAKSDIDHATQFARSMVCEWGMSEKLGPLAFYEEQGEVFLGRDVSHRQRNFSEKTAIDIDDEVRAIVTEQFQRARAILIANKPALDRIALALLERETLDGEQVDQLVKGNPLAPPPRAAPPAMPVEPKRPEEKKSKILDGLGGAGTARRGRIDEARRHDGPAWIAFRPRGRESLPIARRRARACTARRRDRVARPLAPSARRASRPSPGDGNRERHSRLVLRRRTLSRCALGDRAWPSARPGRSGPPGRGRRIDPPRSAASLCG